jgi:hypothetical protein
LSALKLISKASGKSLDHDQRRSIVQGVSLDRLRSTWRCWRVGIEHGIDDSGARVARAPAGHDESITSGNVANTFEIADSAWDGETDDDCGVLC